MGPNRRNRAQRRFCMLHGIIALALTSSVSLAQAQSCNPSIDRARSLVVTDAALNKTKFSFSNTLDAILGSLQIAKTAENRENLVRSLLSSFNADDMVIRSAAYA